MQLKPTVQPKGIKVYIDYMSQPSRVVLIFCKQCKIPIEIYEVDLASKAHIDKSMVAINPSKRVPFIIDTSENDLYIFESGAITRYLANKYLKPNNRFYPRDNLEEQIEIESAINNYYLKVRPICQPVYIKVQATVFNLQDNFDAELVKKNAKLVLEEFDRQLDNRLYVTSLNRMTLADLFYYSEIIHQGVISFDIKKFQNVVDWLNRISVNKVVKDVHWKLRETISGLEKPSLFTNIV